MKAKLVKSFKVGNSLFETYSYLGYVIKHTSFAGWFVHDDERCLSIVEDLSSAESFIDSKLVTTL